MNVNVNNVKLAAVIGSSAIVSAAAIGIAVLQAPASGSIASDMQTGVTVTDTPTPREASIKATPEITGPAPLPVEEQGLPG